MKFLKVLGLAAVAAAVVMALVGAGTASAADTIAICKLLVTPSTALCPAGEVYPSGAKILASASKPKLLSSLGTVECPESKVVAETTAESGATLPISITTLTFGPAGKCSMCPTVDTAPPYAGKVEVEEKEVEKVKVDDFFLNAKGSATLLNCFGFGITCIYGESEIKSLIDTDPAVGFATILINSTLTRQIGSSGLCPSTGTWEANYTVTGIDSGGVNDQPGWITLYKKI